MESSQGATSSEEKKSSASSYSKLIASIPMTPKVLHLPCEWEECSFTTKDIEDFIKHISGHLSGLVNVSPAEQVLGCFNCKWRKCDVSVIGHIFDFTRHVYFHTFHTKIKSIGSLLIKTLSLHPCKLDGQSCNLIPDLPERLQCRWTSCEAIYDNPEFFYRHVDFHADGNTKLKKGLNCQWEGCDVNVKNAYKLREHLRSHTQQKLVACPNCGGLFSNRTKFFDHLHKQTDVQWFQCSHCRKKFQTSRLLRDHIRIHVNSYKCPLCDMTCPNPHGLRNHLLYKHTTERQFKCPKCEFKAKSQSTLQRHMEIHSDNVLMCHEKDCGFVSRLYQCLANHYQKVHQGLDMHQYACHICNQRFNRGTFLTKHLQKQHHYKCPSGYSRFRYTLHSDGFLRLQMVRYEHINLIEQVIDPNMINMTNSSNPETSDNLEEQQSSDDGNKTSDGNTQSVETDAVNSGSESGGGGGGEEVSITYNLEMLGDVALLTPNKLDSHVKHTTDDEEADAGDMDQLETDPGPHSLDAMEQPSTSSLAQLQNALEMDVAEEDSFVSDIEDDKSLSSDDSAANLFGIYSEISSAGMNSV